MDEDDINDLIQKCRKLKYKFLGVFAANNFLQKLHKNSFLILGVSPSNIPGTHWLLLCNRNNKKILWNPWDNLFSPIETYIADSDTNAQICQFLKHEPIQCQNSDCADLLVFILRLIYLVKDKL